MITIGNYSISILETGRFALDGGAMFGVVPKPLWERAYTHADERNRIPMAAKVLLIQGNGRTIIVDTGNSTEMSEKDLDIYGVNFEHSNLTNSLIAAGISTSQVTDVFLTHLHFDHVGGAVVANKPRFENATYWLQEDQWNWADIATEKDRASFMPHMYKPLAEQGVLKLLKGAMEVFEGIHVQPLYGHTIGMQSIRITDGTTSLLYCADLMPTSAHIGIPYIMGYDIQPLETLKEKKALMPTIVEEQWIVVFEHDALRTASTIGVNTKGNPVILNDVDLRIVGT